MVLNTIEHTARLREKSVRILSSVHNLPTVPFIIEEVTKVIEDTRASAAKLGGVISHDQGLVTKILTVANSPLYGIPRRVATIDFAIVILGFNQIKNIVIALSMMETIKKFGDKNFNQKKYWLHSYMVATTAKRIADDLGFPESGEAFTAGLLHDLGIPVIYKYFKSEYDSIVEDVALKGHTHYEAEIKLLGMTHGEIGKVLIDRWNLPEELSEMIVCHHQPSLAENNKQLISLIHLADYVVSQLLEDNFHWDSDFVLDESIIDTLKLGNMEYLNNFVESYKTLFEEQLSNLIY